MGEKQRISLVPGPEHTDWDRRWGLPSLSLSLSFHCVGAGDRTGVIRLGTFTYVIALAS